MEGTVEAPQFNLRTPRHPLHHISDLCPPISLGLLPEVAQDSKIHLSLCTAQTNYYKVLSPDELKTYFSVSLFLGPPFTFGTSTAQA